MVFEMDSLDLSATLSYASSALSDIEAQRLIDSFVQGLKHILQDMNILVDDIDFLSTEQYAQLAAWNTAYPKTSYECVHQLISTRAALQPDAEAICSTEISLTYGELDQMSSRFAMELVAEGVGPEVVVPICSHKSSWAIVAMLSVIKAGGAYTVIDPNFPHARAEHILEVVDAKLVLVTPETISKFSSVHTLSFSANYLLSLSACESTTKTAQVEPNNAFCVVFTSGSTGNPKAITVEHQNYATNARATINFQRMTPATRIFQYSAFNFDVSVRDIFGGLIAGSCICIPTDTERMDHLASTITRFRANFAAITPTVMRLLSPVDVPTLQTVSAGGESLPSDLAQLWSGHMRLINGYGPAEISVCASMREVSAVNESSSSNIGKSLPSCLCWVTNPRNPNVLAPIGAVGEIVVQGPTVTRGYRKDEAKTDASYVQNLLWQWKLGYPPGQQRAYRTGDMARFKSDGSLEFLGRRDAQIKINGQRTELAEIENQLAVATSASLPISVAMISPSDQPQRKVLVALLESPLGTGPAGHEQDSILPAVPETAALASAIRAAAEERLPAFMVPSYYIPIARTPRTNSGKLDRLLLKTWAGQLTWKQLSAYSGGLSKGGKATTEEERALQRLWALILDIEDVNSIGLNDHFIQLGGDSIAAIRLTRAARDQGIQLSSKSIMQHPILGEMASVIDLSRGIDDVLLRMPKPFSLVDSSFTDPPILAMVAKNLQVHPDSIKDAYPCTPLQEGLTASMVMDPASYMSQQVFKLPDEIDLYQFRAAWERIHCRYPILRTRIISIAVAGYSQLLQVVVDEELPWQYESNRQMYLEEDKKAGMSIGQKLCRFALINAEDSVYFVWTAHHAIYDGWSMDLLLQDVSDLYFGRAVASRPSLNSFVQHLTLQDSTLCKFFWTNYLEGYENTEFIQLPGTKSSALATRTVRHHIKAFSANKAQVTNSIVLRVAWALVLAHYSGSQDVVFGCTQSGRTSDAEDVDRLIAPMFATVPVRIKFEQKDPIVSLLSTVQKAANDMLPYEHVGLQNLRQFGSECGDACDFQTILIIQPPIKQRPSPFHDRQHVEGDELLMYALGIECIPEHDQLLIEANFDPEVIDEGTVRRMLQLFVSIVTQITDTDKILIEDIDLLSSQERQMLQSFNNNGARSVDECVHDVIARQTRLTPNAPAMKDDTIELTYDELEKVSRRLASHLVSIGVGPEVIVPLCFEKSILSAVSMLAVLRAGGVCVAFDPALPDARLAEMVERTAAQHILVGPGQEARFDTKLNIIVIDEHCLGSLPLAPISIVTTVEPGNAAFIVFTSGSTGKPKGIVLEHRNVCSTADTMHNVQFLDSSSRVLQFSSYTYDVYIEEIFITLMWGGCVCIPSEDQRRNDLSGFIGRMGVNWVDLTPTVAAMLHPDECPSLTTVVVGGEKLTQDVLETWVDRVNMVYAYGPAECSVICTSTKTTVSKDADVSNVGHSMGGSIWIVNQNDHNRLVPVGSVGEILVEGPIVGREYLNDISATRRSFIVNPIWAIHEAEGRRFYKTGDLGRHNEDGSICIIGRRDSQIKIHGQRVELGDIEHGIAQLLPEGSRVVVEVIPEVSGHCQRELAAFITQPAVNSGQCQHAGPLRLSEEMQIAFRNIQARLSTLLPQHMIPQLFIPVANHPQTPGGKTDRKALRELGRGCSRQERLQYSLAVDTKREPTTAQEKKLRSLWSAILNLAESAIGIDDTFFQLGGNSISAMHLASAARRVGRLIVVRDVFQYPKLSELAARMTSINEPSRPVVAPFTLLPTEKLEHIIEEVQNQLGCASSAIEDVYPCTPLQQNVMASTVRDHSNYVSREIFGLSRNIDLPSFQQAWNTVCSKHAILRTRILPIITSADSIEIYQVVLREDVAWTHAEHLASYLEEDRLLGMEYGTSLCRFAIVDQGDQRKFFVFTAHHAIYDGWSLPMIYREVSDAYAGETLNPSTQFNVFVKYIRGLNQDDSETFWTKQLSGCAPTQFPSTPNQDYDVHATKSLVRGFEHRHYRKHGSDIMLSTVLQAAWAILLASYTVSRDVVYGATNVGRNVALDGIDTMIGPTIATIPLRIQFQGDERIDQFLKRLQNQNLDTAEHQHFGLDRIGRVSNDARQAVQFHNLFVVQPGDHDGSDASALLGLHKVDLELEGFISFPLTLQCGLGEKRVSIKATYDPDLLNELDLSRMLEQFAHISQQLLQVTEGSVINELDLLSPGDVTQLRSWNDYEPEAVKRSIPDVISDFVMMQPDAEAVYGWDGSLTYTELDILSTRLARYLRLTYDVQFHNGIPFCMHKSVWTVVTMLAILKTGGSTIALDPSFSEARIRTILDTTGSRLVITLTDYVNKFQLFQENILVVDESFIRNLPGNDQTDLPPIPPLTPAFILFSSGTTGIPKGIVLEHQAIATSSRAHGRFTGIKPGSRVLQFAAYTFDVSIQDIFTTLQNGGCVCVPSDAQRLDDLAGAINGMRVNWTFLTPTVAKLLAPANVPGLKTLVLGGEATLVENLKTWGHSVNLFNEYGPAEAGIVCAIRKSSDTLDFEPSNVGQSLRSIRCWVTDADDPDRLVPVGVLGELLVEGPSLALNYLKDPQKTAAAFIDTPRWAKSGRISSMHNWRFYRTGDLVRQLADGSLTYMGRKDTQVKFHGQRLELDDIEHQIKFAFDADCQIVVDVVQPRHRAGTDLLAAFVRMPTTNEKNGIQQHIIAEIKEDYVEKVQEAKRLLGKLLPAYAIPSLWIPVTHMPTSLSQKLDRKTLKETASMISPEDMALCSFSSSIKRPPVSDLEISLASLWSKLLKVSVDFLGLDDSFFEMGGDSITAMKLVALARKNNIVLPMTTIFRKPRLVDMATAAGSLTAGLSTKSRLKDITPFSLLQMSQKHLSSYLDTLAADWKLARSSITDVYPCTPMQEGLFASTMSNASLYMAQFVYEIGEDIDLELFVNAWHESVRQTPVLRTRIVPAPWHSQHHLQSYQVVLDKPVPWQHYNGDDLESFLAAEMPIKIDYGSDLVKFAILQGQKRRFVMTIHHALYDGWSLPILFSFVEHIYLDFPRGNLVPYSHFVRSLLDVPEEESAEFWTEQLSGCNTTEFPRIPNTSYVPTIDGALERRLTIPPHKFVGIMPATLIQAAWALVLSAHSGTDDVVFLSTQMGRSSDLDGIQDIIGCTVATVPIRFVLDRSNQLGTFLRYAQERNNDLTRFEHYGLQNIQRLGTEQRSACKAGSLIVIQPQKEKSKSKLGLIPIDGDDTQMLSHPLVIECNLGSGFIDIRLGFDTKLLAHQTMEQVVDQLAHVLHQISTMKEETALTNIDILSPYELEILRKWNSNPPSYESETVHEAFRSVVRREPGKLAVDAWDGHLSYADLDRLSDRLAQQLRRSGLTNQQVVPLAFEKSAWTIVAVLAVAKAGCVFVMFDPSSPLERCLEICQEVQAQLILTSAEQSTRWTEHFDIFTVDEATLGGLPDMDQKVTIPCAPTNVLYLIFTSGSTGKPKGCVIEHGSFLAAIKSQRQVVELGSFDRMLQFASYSFDVSILEIFSALLAGACLCVPNQNSCSTDIVNVLRSWRITWSYLTPSLTRTIDARSVPDLRTLALVGEQVTSLDVRKWADKVTLINGYGPSECSVAAASYIGVKVDTEPSNIGLPMGCVCWVVDPNDHDRLCPIGTVGELVIDGPIVARGYLNNEEKTIQSFINTTHWLPRVCGRKHTRMYKTGDLVRANWDRTITFIGRKDSQVKVRGQRMELGEPEHHLSDNPVVHTAVVLKGQKGGRLDGSLVAILSLQKAPASTFVGAEQLQLLPITEELSSHVSHLRSWLEKKVPSYMIPTTWIFLQTISLLPSGKVDRKRLQTWLHNIQEETLQQCVGLDDQPDDLHIQDATSASLREAVSQALGIPVQEVKFSRSFIAQGGDSISAMQVHSQLRKMHLSADFKYIISTASLFDVANTLERLEDGLEPIALPEERMLEPFALSPMQSYYAQYALGEDELSRSTNRNFNFTFNFTFDASIPMGAIEDALKAVVERHSMLRARFYIDKAGQWKQIITNDVQESYKYNVHKAASPIERDLILETSRTSLDIKTGPLLRVDVIITSRGEKSLHLVLHHLVTDRVSWSILISDLETHISTGSLPVQRLSSFQVWTEVLAQDVVEQWPPQRALPYTVPEANFDFWGMTGIPNTDNQSVKRTLRLPTDLLSLVRSNTGWNDVELSDILTVALSSSFKRFFPEREPPTIFNQDHGRQLNNRNIDLSQTVGWCTAFWPIHISPSAGEDPVAMLERTKTLRQSVPQNGQAYFASRYYHPEGIQAFGGHDKMEIFLNYLGDFRKNSKDNSLFKMMGNVDSGLHGEKQDVKRYALFSVGAMIEENEMRVVFGYNKNSKHTERIEKWVQDFESHMNWFAQCN